MEIFGVKIPGDLMIVILAILGILGGIKYLTWRFKMSAFYWIYHTIRKALKEEPLEEMDFKEYRMDDDIQKIDENFDKADFLKTVENVLRQYCKAMSENEHRLLLSFETPNLFQRHKGQIEYNKKAQIKDVHKLQEFLGAKFVQVKMEQNKLVVEARANMFRYKLNKNGSLLSGSQSDLRKLIYQMIFVKQAGQKEVDERVNCPNCGAPHEVHSAGICQYCGTMIVTLKDNWLLDDLKQM
ncbi:hypothetical protein EII17_08005 [Clostridiales bacterium COT073_COT-073]|nr:hypothetical protein EII17_08005 [Clostridiales bacterium COT073_COT-073]